MTKTLVKQTWSRCAAIAILGAVASGNSQTLKPILTPGSNADIPPFVSERNGVFQYPWGAANYIWPEQLFWEGVAQIREKGQDMRQDARGIEGRGLVPLLSSVAWGYEYKASIGGDPALGLADKTKDGGWKEFGQWIQPREEKYLARDWDGKLIYPYAGYITPLMPLDKADWPAGIDSATFGDYAGVKLGSLANQVEARGIFAADFVVGLYGSNHDFHPRVMADFEKWSGVTLVGSTDAARAKDIISKHWPAWNNFKCHRFARFYARIAQTVKTSGREPLVGGQILPQAALVRPLGNDFRIYLQYLPAKNWYFQVELQSDEGRHVPDYWTSSTYMGAHAARAPEFPLGAHMDAYQNGFWVSVLDNNKKDSAWGRKYMKHHWLSVGFTHIARTDGSVKRAARAFQRAYWDAGSVEPELVEFIREHQPKYPFGMAFYYSTEIEKQLESTGEAKYYWMMEARAIDWRRKGVPAGYFVSDTALASSNISNRPSAWLVETQDKEGFHKMTTAERTRLEAIAPIATEANFRNYSPLVFEGDSLGGYAFINQHGNVIVVVSNSSDNAVTGNMKFARVENGTYEVKELLGTSTGTLTIAANGGTYPLKLDGRDTKVFQIPGLREINRGGSQTSVTPRKKLAPSVAVGSAEPRIDAKGRTGTPSTRFQWSVPAP